MTATKNIDQAAVYELSLYTVNTGRLYVNMVRPLIKNYQRKIRRGVYDAEKALKGWENVAAAAAQLYHREFGSSNIKWYTIFPPAVRREVAKYLQDYYSEDLTQ